MKLSNVPISSHIVSYNAIRFLILKRFDHRNEVLCTCIVTIFCCIIPTWGAKPRTGGAIIYLVISTVHLVVFIAYIIIISVIFIYSAL